MVKFPSNICNKILAKNHKAICCDLCDICVDTICNKKNVATYNMSQNNETKLYCIEYSKERLTNEEKLIKQIQLHIILLIN